ARADAVRTVVDVERVGRDRVVAVSVDLDLLRAVDDLELVGGRAASVDVVEVDADPVGEATPAVRQLLEIGVRVGLRIPRHGLVAPRAPGRPAVLDAADRDARRGARVGDGAAGAVREAGRARDVPDGRRGQRRDLPVAVVLAARRPGVGDAGDRDR